MDSSTESPISASVEDAKNLPTTSSSSASTFPAPSTSSPSPYQLVQQPQVSLERMPISIVPKHISQPAPQPQPEAEPLPAPSSNPATPARPPLTSVFRIRRNSSGKPQMVVSPASSSPMTDSLDQNNQLMSDGAKKRRGERGPDKNPNIDPRTGKRRYIKRKRFGLGLEPFDSELYLDSERKKKARINKYYTSKKSGFPKLNVSGLHHHRHYQHRHRHRTHHSTTTSKYFDSLIIAQRGTDDDEASLYSSWEDISTEDLVDEVWRPTDDLRLIVNIRQTNDLKSVKAGTKFSCHFSLESIEARWEYLLYDKSMAKVAQNAIRNLPGKVKSEIYSLALFSKKEHDVLGTVKSTTDNKSLLPAMTTLLEENPHIFLRWRTPKKLRAEWMFLRECCLLCDQDVESYFEAQHFDDFEFGIKDSELYPVPYVNQAIIQEKIMLRKLNRKDLCELEAEVKFWLSLSEIYNEIVPRVFEEGSYAMLRGRQVRYLMRSEEITFGRRTEDNMVDADFGLEGSTYKISRRQGVIQMKEKGRFTIMNQGKHSMFVNGRPLLPNATGQLRDNSVIHVSMLKFIFLINFKMIREIDQREHNINMQNAKRREALIQAQNLNPGSRTKYFSPIFSIPPPLHHPVPSSPLSLSSILSPSFSNTLPALNVTNKKPLYNSKPSALKLNKKESIYSSTDNTASFSDPSRSGDSGAINTSPAASSQLSNTFRPSWYLEHPPPLMTTKITSPVKSYLPIPTLSSGVTNSPIFHHYTSLGPSSSPSPFIAISSSNSSLLPTALNRNIIRTSSTLSNLNLNSSPVVATSNFQPTTGILGSTSHIQFGDITIRPGAPPPPPPPGP